MSFTVAIDGPAASGKGTIARGLAGRFGLAHLDTGLLYRAVGARTLRGEVPESAAAALGAADLEGAHLRGAEVAQAASRVAALPGVRAALVDFQRAFAARAGGAVLDGRDIGTVICPEAPVKLYVTAAPRVRAERRWKELRARGEEVSLAEVLADVESRDARDMGRADAPLRPAEDAVMLDTSQLSIAEALEAAAAAVEAARAARGGGETDG